MASSKFKIFSFKNLECVYSFPQFLKCCCLLLYYRLYRIIYTSFVIEIIQSLYFGALSFIFGNREKLQWKTHWQSPVCHGILKRKYFMTRSKSSLTWASCSFIFASLFFIDLKNDLFVNLFGSYSTIVWYAELLTCSILLLNALSALSFYVWSILSKPLPISPVQQKLFCIKENDPGFEVKQKDDSVTETKLEPLRFSSFSDSFNYSSPSLISVTPLNYSFNSWGSTSPSSMNVDTSSSSWSFRRGSSPLSYSTPKSAHADRIALRRLDYTANLDSSYERPIKSRKHLEEFLKAQEEESLKSISNDESKHFLSSMTAVENSPMSMLGKCFYQRAYRLPNAESTEDNSSEIHGGENIWNKLRINDKMLLVWCERIRKWICQTILVKLVQEIDDINNTLVEMGLPEFQIGNVSLLALNQLAMAKAQQLSTLSAVLPYLDIHLNQEYLVKRLKNLAHGGCMGNFKWNAGDNSGDKSWCDDLPNDATLIMHVLCCYFDAHLPPEPHFPEGKPFSSKYFKKIPEKPVLSKELFYIYQSSSNPPHFKVVLHEDIYSLHKGRNNLFCSLVIFLHYIKTKECGMLGRVNLGRSGLNILWVLD